MSGSRRLRGAHRRFFPERLILVRPESTLAPNPAVGD